MAGLRMRGNTYGLDTIDNGWATYLQDASDAVVFGDTPANFPPYPWKG
jgi:hypothetical protein